jgi:hypothetical protein
MPVSNDLTDADLNNLAFDLALQRVFREMLEQDEEASPTVVQQIAKVMAHSVSGWNPPTG